MDVKVLIELVSGAVLINVHAGKDEGGVEDLFHEKFLKVGFVPIAFVAITLGEEEKKSFLFFFWGPVVLFNDGDEVGAVNLEDAILDDGGGVSALSAEIGLELSVLEISHKLSNCISCLDIWESFALLNDGATIQVTCVNVLQYRQEELLAFNDWECVKLEIVCDIPNFEPIDDCEIILGELGKPALIKELGNKLEELYVGGPAQVVN